MINTKFKRNGWSDAEMLAASTCRDKGWCLTKTWKEERYTIYNIIDHTGATMQNQLLSTHDLKEVYKFLNLPI